MALSSAGWVASVPVQVPAQQQQQQAGCSGLSTATACCSTVLMSVRVSVCHSGIRPLCLPGTGSDALRLQLSMDPGRAGEFRLALRDTSGNRSVFIAEFDLRSVQYEVKSSRCHEMHLLAPPHERNLVAPPHERHLVAPPHDCIRFNFRCDREAEEWATVVMSSIREAHRVAAISRNESENKPNAVVTEQWSPSSLPLSEELCLELSKAIEAGDCQAASHYAAVLARQKASLSVRLSEKSYADAEISLSVVVEDVSSSCCVSVRVFPFMTVGALKQQVFEEHGFPPRVQRWVISQSLCTERRSLASYGVQRDGDTAYLYLISARQAHITRQLLQQDLESPLLAPPLLPLPPSNGPASQDWRGYSTLPSRLHHAPAGGCDVKDKLQLNGPLHKTRKNQQTEWACPSCTFINKPTRPGCEICTTARPDNTTLQQDDRGEGAQTTSSSS